MQKSLLVLVVAVALTAFVAFAEASTEQGIVEAAADTGAKCKISGLVCKSDNDCCGGLTCNSAKKCERKCTKGGDRCTKDDDCCSSSCGKDGMCMCYDFGATCSWGAECCTGSCSSKKGCCTKSGNSCSSGNECCSGICKVLEGQTPNDVEAEEEEAPAEAPAEGAAPAAKPGKEKAKAKAKAAKAKAKAKAKDGKAKSDESCDVPKDAKAKGKVKAKAKDVKAKAKVKKAAKAGAVDKSDWIDEDPEKPKPPAAKKKAGLKQCCSDFGQKCSDSEPCCPPNVCSPLLGMCTLDVKID